MENVVTKAERETALDTMRPIEIGCILYQRGGMTARKFYQDVKEHLCNAFVISTPRHFMMFRAVLFDDSEPDWDGKHGWLINSGVGPAAELLALLPFKLDAIAFCRRGKSRLHIYDFDRLAELISRKGAKAQMEDE